MAIRGNTLFSGEPFFVTLSRLSRLRQLRARVGCKTPGLSMEDVRQLLKRLGQTADAVAQTLDAEGIRGVRNTARFLNPIVRLIHMWVGDDTLHMDVMRGD